MRLYFSGGRYAVKCAFENRDVPKKAGFSFDKDEGVFFTPSVQVAARLREYADKETKRRIDRSLLRYEPWSGCIPFPDGLSPKAYQIEAALFSLSRNRSYQAIAPGLGKTIVATLISNALPSAGIVYVCPAFLTLNVQEEFRKWAPKRRTSVYGRDDLDGDVLIVPDSIIHRPEVLEVLRKFVGIYSRVSECILFTDEAHRFKEPKSLRTAALFEYIFPLFDRAIFLSGTPRPNRNMELYPVISKAAPELIDYMSRFDFGRRYCAGHRDSMGHWDFSGDSNSRELAERVVGKFMNRIRKSDVLDLPPKLEEMVIVGENLTPKLADLDAKILAKNSPEDLMQAEIGVEHVSTYRKELGIAKVPVALPFIRSILDDTEEAVIVVAHHKDVVAKLVDGLRDYEPLVITGDVEKFKRHAVAREFLSNPKRRLIVINIQAGGIGYNLTKASRVVFVEFSWTPADNEQAGDRAHRIGQASTVLCQYLVFKNSLDRKVMEACFRKKRANAY